MATVPSAAGHILRAEDWTLPTRQETFGNGTNSITSTTFAVLPTTTADVSMTNPHLTRTLECLVTYGCWMQANGQSVEATIVSSGGLTITSTVGSGGPLGFGEVLILGNQATNNSIHQFSTFFCELPADTTTTFAWQALRGGASGTEGLNYPTIRVEPKRFL